MNCGRDIVIGVGSEICQGSRAVVCQRGQYLVLPGHPMGGEIVHHRVGMAQQKAVAGSNIADVFLQ